jgi:Flp pilus assembly protein TadD
MNTKGIKVAASTIAIGAMLVGCSSSSSSSHVAGVSSKATPSLKQAGAAYQNAQKLLHKGDLPGALAAMEKAVEYSPQDAGFRRGLAELYVRSGRFASAEATFADVVAINPSDSRAGFYLALTKIAQNKTLEAITQLESMDSGVDASDLGLAFALAGDSRRALTILEPAARAPGANGRVRQNLALTYALAGDWKKARAVAAQDVSPNDLAKRLQQWAKLASPQANETRIASLLEVTPVQDPGQPARLALAPAQAEAAFAEAAPVEQPAPIVEAAPAPDVIVAAAQVEPAPVEAPAPIEVAEVSAPVAAPAVSEEVQARYVEAAQTLVDPTPAVAPSIAPSVATAVADASDPIPAPVPAIVERRASIPAPVPAYVAAKFTSRKAKAFSRGPGRYVVQIGAFSSPRGVERAWSQAINRYKFAANQEPLSTTVKIPGKGTFHRLSVAGFGSASAASKLCQSIKARQGACFVRTIAGDAPVQWASRYSRKA